ncbi:low density lipoprotein receptor adapter protein 1-B-like [Ambystoma mexicanum]|uniref:low density lipoprotein receptor adapter protein 1-B-like n=1 Tax=Ambystoma mexicanum TaxID=8296 RepID=UPI0037E90E09
MSFSNSHLVKTIRKSPAVLRQKFSKDKVKRLSHGDPLFKVHYLGMEKIYSLQVEQTHEVVAQLLSACQGKPQEKDHALVVRPRYLEVKEIASGRQITKTYLHDIACCTADPAIPNIFLYICKHRGQLQCRVFLCNKAEKAKAITACLAKSFERAFSDWQGAYGDHDAIPEEGEESKMQSQQRREGRTLQGRGTRDGTSTEDEDPEHCQSLETSDEEAEVRMHNEFKRRVSSSTTPHRLDTGRHSLSDLEDDVLVQPHLLGDRD